MHKAHHRMTELFQQLGLPSEDAEIHEFLSKHRPLPAGKTLAEAEFWTASQASFIREALMLDSDWTGIVDQLNEALRASQ